MPIDFEERTTFHEYTKELPLPVAEACTDVIRADSASELLDAVVKAAERLARYLGAAAIAAFRYRQHTNDAGLPLDGNLSFGHFTTLVRRVAKLDFDNSLSRLIRESRGALEPLEGLVTIRNRAVGHHLAALTEGHATAQIQEANPPGQLVKALRLAEPILRLPLIVVDAQTVAKGKKVAELLLLFGDNPRPEPVRVTVEDHVAWTKQLYLMSGEDAYRLPPALVWCLSPAAAGSRLFYLDSLDVADGSWSLASAVGDRYGATGNKAARYSPGASLPWEELRMPAYLEEAMGDAPTSVLKATPSPQERLVLADEDKTVESLWNAQRPRKVVRVEIPWERFDPAALRQWVSLAVPGSLDDSKEPRSDNSKSSGERYREAVSKKLLQGRQKLEPEELRQLVLLFGRDDVVREAVGRDLVMIRRDDTLPADGDGIIRCSGNVLSSLKALVDALRSSPNLPLMSESHLGKRDGDADYLAMREAIVNLLIHQDYHSKNQADVSLGRMEAVFTNPGYSLVDVSDLTRGMRSQPRNGLLAEALRLMGFAELRASGVLTMLNAWDRARRERPAIVSSAEDNTFRISFTWRYRSAL